MDTLPEETIDKLNVGDATKILDDWLANKVIKEAEAFATKPVPGTAVESAVNYLAMNQDKVTTGIATDEVGDWLIGESFGLYMVDKFGFKT